MACHVWDDIVSTASEVAEKLRRWFGKNLAHSGRRGPRRRVGWVQQIATDADGSWSSEPDDVLNQLHSSWHAQWRETPQSWFQHFHSRVARTPSPGGRVGPRRVPSPSLPAVEVPGDLTYTERSLIVAVLSKPAGEREGERGGFSFTAASSVFGPRFAAMLFRSGSALKGDHPIW